MLKVVDHYCIGAREPSRAANRVQEMRQKRDLGTSTTTRASMMILALLHVFVSPITRRRLIVRPQLSYFRSLFVILKKS